METLNILIILMGLFFIAGAMFDWDFFMESPRVRRFSRLLGSRQRGRVGYGLMGLVLIALGFIF